MKKGKERSAWSWIFEFAGMHKRMYVGSVFLAIVCVGFSIIPYFIMADLIKDLFAGERNVQRFLVQCLIIGLCFLGKAIFHALSTGMSHKATFHVLGTIRKRCLDKFGKVSLGDIQSRPSGELKSILVEQIDSIETTLAHILPEFTSNLLGSLVMFIYLFVIDWRMGLTALIPVPVGFICFMGMISGYNENYQRVLRAVKGLNDSAVEYIGGIEVIKVFGKTKNSYERFVTAAKEGAQSYIDWMRKCNLFFTFATVIMPATLVSILPIGGMLVKGGSLSPTDFIMIMILALGLMGPVMACMSYSDDIAKLKTVIGEVVSILEEKEMVRPKGGQKMIQEHTVHFENVHFGYGDTEVLKGINIEFREGEVTALVGPSGSGKSTIAKLLASYWDVNSGKITIGGADIRELSMNDYYKEIAYVSQDNFLFDDTIRENIRMGNRNATDEEVEEAARKCGCHDFIMRLESGYDKKVGGAGGHLSSGERQRIAIARAMLKDAPIIILDEATAYTDPENEAIIQSSIAKLVKGKTLIVIAHRLSTITDADKIVVINDGNVDSQGTQEELLQLNGLYRRMWEAHIAAKDGESINKPKMKKEEV